MSRQGTAVLAFLGLIAIAILMVGCSGFFVSPNSLGNFTVSPPSAVLSSSVSAGLLLSANGTAVSGNSIAVSPTWTSSDTSCTAISFSATGCTPTTTAATVTVTPVAAGSATITVTASGAQTQYVYISVQTGTIDGITATVPTTTASPGQTITESVAASNGAAIQCQYVNFGTPPAGTTFTCTNNANFLNIVISTTSTTSISATGISQVTLPTPTVTTNSSSGNQTLTPTTFSGTINIL
jgi:hypothetical protein